MRRRALLKAGLMGAVAGVVQPNSLASLATDDRDDVCLLLGNHSSYIGEAWSLGVESCALALLDCLNVSDQGPIKLCINFDARAYELLAKEYPLLCNRLREYLTQDKVEIVGGSYSQPMATLFSGESSIRQIVMGHEVIWRSLGHEIDSFWEEEEFAHPQLPQILRSAGVNYTSLSQHDSLAYAGAPELELNVFNWKAMDGTPILCLAKNRLHAFAWFDWDHDAGGECAGIRDVLYFSTPEGRQDVRRYQKMGKPCIQAWDEMGAEDPGAPHYLTLPQRLEQLSEGLNVEYVTLRGYLRKYGGHARESIYLGMDAWKKLLPWGIGGEQIRVTARKVEAALHAAERFDAIAQSLGMRSQSASLEAAWRDLLTAQSHDANLCEYLRQYGPPPEPGLSEDHHGQTWGSVAYNHLDKALEGGDAALKVSLDHLTSQDAGDSRTKGPLVLRVFNACSWERSAIARTGKLYVKSTDGGHLCVTNSAGQLVPFQVERRDIDSSSGLAMVDVSFLAERVPPLGYDSYRLRFTQEPIDQPNSPLTIDEVGFKIENDHVRLRLNPTHGGIAELVEKKSGKKFLSGERLSTPTFHGVPNLQYPFLVSEPDATYNSGLMEGKILWLEKGPLRATLKSIHKWKQLTYETRVSLSVHSAHVEVLTRVFMSVPPAVDDFPSGHAERDINHGYWLTFAPAFETNEVRRDFPLGVETTKSSRLHGLSFVDLCGNDRGLLILHSGSQYFRKESDGTWSNLMVREWDSVFTKSYGYPDHAEFRHSLCPHGTELDDIQRVRKAMEFDSGLFTNASAIDSADSPARSFLKVNPDNVLVSAFRSHPDGGFELRVLEIAGRPATAKISAGFAWTHVVETDLRGRPVGEPLEGPEPQLALRPWQFRTLRFT